MVSKEVRETVTLAPGFLGFESQEIIDKYGYHNFLFPIINCVVDADIIMKMRTKFEYCQVPCVYKYDLWQRD